MGLVYIKEVEGNSLLGVWEMDDAIEAMAHQLPSSTALPVQSIKRKKEYIAIRLLMDVMYAGAEIKYHKSGKPYLLNDDSQISISHSQNLVCILLNKSNSVGIDVQFISGRINRLKEKFLSDLEIAALPENPTDALHVYWCAKEALYKLLGEENVEFKKHLFIDSFILSTQGNIRGNILMNDTKTEIPLIYEKTGNYFLVYTID